MRPVYLNSAGVPSGVDILTGVVELPLMGDAELIVRVVSPGPCSAVCDGCGVCPARADAGCSGQAGNGVGSAGWFGIGGGAAQLSAGVVSPGVDGAILSDAYGMGVTNTDSRESYFGIDWCWPESGMTKQVVVGRGSGSVAAAPGPDDPVRVQSHGTVGRTYSGEGCLGYFQTCGRPGESVYGVVTQLLAPVAAPGPDVAIPVQSRAVVGSGADGDERQTCGCVGQAWSVMRLAAVI